MTFPKRILTTTLVSAFSAYGTALTTVASHTTQILTTLVASGSATLGHLFIEYVYSRNSSGKSLYPYLVFSLEFENYMLGLRESLGEDAFQRTYPLHQFLEE